MTPRSSSDPGIAEPVRRTSTCAAWLRLASMYRPGARYFVVLVAPRAVHRSARDGCSTRPRPSWRLLQHSPKATTENAEHLELPSAAIDAGVRDSGRVACRSPAFSIGWWVTPCGLEKTDWSCEQRSAALGPDRGVDADSW